MSARQRFLMMVIILFFLLGARIGYPLDEIETSKNPQILTLEMSIETALKNNTSITQELERLKAGGEAVKKAFADFLPKLSMSYDYTRLSEEPFVVAYGETFPVGDKDHCQWDVTVTQPLFTGFALKSRHQIAKTEVKIEKAVVDQTILEVVKEVKVAYFRILLAQKYLMVAEEAVKQLQSHADDAEKFYQQGIIPYNDLLKSAVALADAKQSRVRAESNVKLAISVFNTVLRFGINEKTEVEDILEFKPFGYSLDEAIKIALEQRDELKALHLSLKKTDHEIKLAKSQYYPQLNLVGNYQRTGEDLDASRNDFENSHNESIMLQLNWLIFEWGKTRAEVSKNRYEKRGLNEKLIGTEDRIKLEVKEGYLDLLVAQENIETARETLKQAKENYRITDLQYQQQITTSTEVLDARTLLTQAETNYYNALYGYNIALAGLGRAMGEKVVTSQ